MAVGDKYFAVMKNELAVSNGVATLGPDGLLNASQRPITDSMPTQGSSNPVQSGGVFSALSNKVNLPISIPAAADLNEYTIPGMYFCKENGSTVKNTPAPAASFSLFVEKTGAWGTGVKQTFTHFSTGGTCQRVLGYDASDAKGPWVPLATATPPQEYDLPLAEGWTSQISRSCRYAITQENVVVVTFKAVHSAATPASTDTMIATLPDGFRPTALVHSVCIRSDFVSSSIAVFCAETGGVWIHSSQEIPSGVGVAGEIIFVAAS